MPQNLLPAAATAIRLTGALRSAGVLGDGQVADVAVQSDKPTILSRILRLCLTYDRSIPNAPETLILKTGLPRLNQDDWNSGRQETEFYAAIAPALPPGIVPRCFDAQYNAASNEWHLLLEDLTDTHAVATEWPLPPSQAQCEAILTARARHHAAWWDDHRLGVTAGTWLDHEAFEMRRKRLEGHYGMFVDRFGDILPAERRALYDRFLDAMPRLFGRYHTHRNITIVQADSHVWNCFLPRNGGHDVRFFDWDGWRVSVPAVDLSYMMALHWYPDRRRRLERLLLDHYHAGLLANGVAGYDRQALDDDYRWAVLMQIATPVSHAAFQLPPVIWWNHLERIMLAVDDLGCRELLG